MSAAPDGRPGPIGESMVGWVTARDRSRAARSGGARAFPGMPRRRRAAAGGRRLGQRAADVWPPFAYGLRIETEPRPDPAAEADASELVGVLVDEPDRDVVVLGDAACGPEPVVVGSDGLGARGFSAGATCVRSPDCRAGDRSRLDELGEVRPEPGREAIGDLSARALTNSGAGSVWMSRLSPTTVAVTPAASCSAPGTRRPSRPCR